MHFRSRTVLPLAFFACALPLVAQISHGGSPVSIKHKKGLAPLVEVILPAVDVAALKSQDLILDQDKSIPWRFGYNHAVDIGTTTCGNWSLLANGDRLWRVAIESADALSINFEFDVFDLPPGAQVFVINEADAFIGAFTSDNDPLGLHVLGVQPIQGDRIIVEYRVPSGAPDGALHIDQVTHAYRDAFDMAKAFGTSGSCNVNSICDEVAWGPQISSVAMIVVGGSGYCTGSLINNCANNGTPYFMTANHCTSGANVATWVFRFNWESPTCTPTQNAPTTQTVSGATLLASSAGSDMALLQLTTTPPAAYGVYYLGYDNSGTQPANQTCIHHPDGDIKKISHDNQSAVTATYGGATCWRILNWESGTTEPGSSGSCLLDQNKRFIGQLYGGTASCSNNIDDYFGKFSVSYPLLSSWLGSCGTTLDGFDPNAPTVALDAQMQAINNFAGTTCSATASPVAVVRNGGSTTLTSFTLNYQLNGGATQTQGWTGSLASGATVNVNLAAQTLVSGNNTLVVNVTAPNGGTDLVPANDQATASMTYGSNSLTLQLNLDRYGDETTWSVTGPGGTPAYSSGGPYTQQATNGVYPQAPITICLPNGCYELRVNDSFGDGMWGGFGNGNYTLTTAGGTIVASGGTMTTQTITTFCLPQACTPTLPYAHTFDANMGGWLLNTTGVDFQWSRSNVATPTASTGPDADHTGGGYFMFCETNAPNNPTKTAILTSPCFDLGGYTSASMTFWRHLYGATMGTLNVDVQMNGGAWTTAVWTLTGNQGNSWVQATVNLTPYISPNTRVRFRGVTGSGSTGDMAVDDVALTGTTGVKLAADLWLEGPYNTGTSLMNDDLRAAGSIPLSEPFTALGFSNAAGGGGETTTAGALATTGNNAIVDWVRVELRSSSDPSTIVATRHCLVQRDGDVVAADGVSDVTLNVTAASYHVVVRHRNHFGCMTAAAVALSSTATTIDFRNSGTLTFGTDARKSIGGAMALWMGNTLRDAPAPFLLKYTGTDNDRDPILSAIGGTVPTATATGYLVTDCNMDGTVKYTGTANDRDPILSNIGGVIPTNTRIEQLP